MIAVFFVLLALFSSIGIIQKFWKNAPPHLIFVLSVAVSVMATSWVGLLLSWLFGYTLGISLLIISMSGLLLLFPPHLPSLKKWQPSWHFFLFVIAGTFLFTVLFERAFFSPTEHGWATVFYTYGDLALHSTYINYFAEQHAFSWQSPLYTSDTINYPFLINFYTALLVKMGLTVRMALILSSLQLITPALVSLYFVSYNITKKALTPLIAALLFFFNGGTKGIEFFTDWRNSGKPLADFSTHLSTDYAHHISKGYLWSNSITTHLLPQRGFLFGFLLLLVFLFACQHIWYSKKINISQLYFLSVLVGLLPLFHTHAFLIIAPLLIWVCANLWFEKKISLNTTLSVLSSMVLLGVCQLLFLSPDHNFIALQIGWMAKENWLLFWWQNMGISLGLLLVTPILFWRTYKNRILEKRLLIPAISVFVICNIFIFQPNAWDNMKFLLLNHMMISIITAAVLTYFWKTLPNKIIISVILIASCWSGLLSVMYVYTNPTILATQYDLHITQFIKDTPAGSVFLTADTHNHPVPMLTGRPIVLGYRGWLWTHGINYSETERDVKAIYEGDGTLSLLSKYNIDYIIVGPQEKQNYQVKVSYFKKNFPVIYEDGITTMYKVR